MSFFIVVTTLQVVALSLLWLKLRSVSDDLRLVKDFNLKTAKQVVSLQEELDAFVRKMREMQSYLDDAIGTLRTDVGNTPVPFELSLDRLRT